MPTSKTEAAGGTELPTLLLIATSAWLIETIPKSQKLLRVLLGRQRRLSFMPYSRCQLILRKILRKTPNTNSVRGSSSHHPWCDIPSDRVSEQIFYYLRLFPNTIYILKRTWRCVAPLWMLKTCRYTPRSKSNKTEENDSRLSSSETRSIQTTAKCLHLTRSTYRYGRASCTITTRRLF